MDHDGESTGRIGGLRKAGKAVMRFACLVSSFAEVVAGHVFFPCTLFLSERLF